LQAYAFRDIPHQLVVGGRKVHVAWFRYMNPHTAILTMAGRDDLILLAVPPHTGRETAAGTQAGSIRPQRRRGTSHPDSRRHHSSRRRPHARQERGRLGQPARKSARTACSSPRVLFEQQAGFTVAIRVDKLLQPQGSTVLLSWIIDPGRVLALRHRARQGAQGACRVCGT
jgi:hypothetical protein